MFHDHEFTQYVRSLHGRGRLDASTERRLAQHWHATRDPGAARVLIESHLLFVVKVAHSFGGYGIPVAELVAEGNVGLVEALEQFDVSRNVRFISYAVWWIRARILAHVQRNWSVVRLPGRSKPSFRNQDSSLDAPLSLDGPTKLELIPDDGQAPDDAASRVQRERIVRRELELIEPTLSKRERYIVRHRILAHEPETLRSVGRRFGISRERARQIEARLKEKLRDAFAELGPERRAA